MNDENVILQNIRRCWMWMWIDSHIWSWRSAKIASAKAVQFNKLTQHQRSSVFCQRLFLFNFFLFFFLLLKSRQSTRHPLVALANCVRAAVGPISFPIFFAVGWHPTALYNLFSLFQQKGNKMKKKKIETKYKKNCSRVSRKFQLAGAAKNCGFFFLYFVMVLKAKYVI